MARITAHVFLFDRVEWSEHVILVFAEAEEDKDSIRSGLAGM